MAIQKVMAGEEEMNPNPAVLIIFQLFISRKQQLHSIFNYMRTMLQLQSFIERHTDPVTVQQSTYIRN